MLSYKIYLKFPISNLKLIVLNFYIIVRLFIKNKFINNSEHTFKITIRIVFNSDEFFDEGFKLEFVFFIYHYLSENLTEKINNFLKLCF